jgi:glycosyltransferase involved in cell wall biosynthesis
MTSELKQISDVKPLLTIAIPTYNRAPFLKEILSSLFDQLITESRVELIVSDNASSDATPDVVEQFVRRGLPLRSIRNVINVGPDANFLQCFEQARGKYVWIFGDDDILVGGGIAAILSYCGAKEYDILYVNQFPLTDMYKPRTCNAGISAIEISDAREFVRRINIFFTFISANIINKDRVLASNPAPFSELIDTNLMQLGWTYAALNGFERGLYIEEKLIGARANSVGGYKLLEVFGSSLVRVTRDRLHSENLRHLIFNGTIQRFWPTMIYRYKNENVSFEDSGRPREILGAAFKDNYRYWIYVFPILVLPSFLAACWLYAVRVVNRIDKALGFLLLN